MFTAALVAVLLCGVPADAPVAVEPPTATLPPAAVEPPAAATAAPHAALTSSGPTGPRMLLATGTASLVSLASMVATGFAAWLLPGSCFLGLGRPEPLCTTAGLLLGGATQLGLAVLLVPEVFRLANDPLGHGDPAAVRLELWRLSRWAALAAGVCGLVFGTGALAERTGYGNGQGLMIGGGIGLLVSWVAFDVLTVVGAARGQVSSWRAW